jgi:hypothetical protein
VSVRDERPGPRSKDPPNRSPGDVHPATLLFAVFGGHAAWTLQLFGLAGIVALGCPPGAARFDLLGRPWVEVAFVAVSAGAIVITLAAIAVALDLLSRSRRRHWRGDERSRGRTRFLSVLGALLSAITLTVVVTTATSPAFLGC